MSPTLAVLAPGQIAPHHLQPLDWLVVVVYVIGMLAIGWFYSRRNQTREDYFLGSRAMKPGAIGLSLFATLLSSISYLSWPGEMIKHGPVLFFIFLAYPFIILVVGWFLIPFFMKLPVTSAYQLLEARLGPNVRLLGAIFFLSLRLLWMAMIIYATADKVLIPLTGLNPSLGPLVCGLVGVVTIAYTSAGGIRAVVFTDVAQSFILFAGAAITLAVITIKMGGFGGWWPDQWYESWDRPRIWFGASDRTIAGGFLAAFTWYVCTCGSDQMAIQRYLATRDVKSARNAFTISMVTDAVVTLFLGAVGLSLIAYVRAHPEMLLPGQTITSMADQIFPRFIVLGLPIGFSGLVVAALLSAAMSSLSSGLNSSSSVISIDLLERFRPTQRSEREHLRMNRRVSIAVGLLVVALSLYVSTVPGNLLEVAYRVVNLFVAPLFFLFFMAMFVPWATSFGTLFGAAFSVAVAVGIGHFRLFGLDFLWIMPGSLVAGIIAGAGASFLPIGAPPQPFVPSCNESARTH
jgi:solute:Na+ symporter, SSS family